jgi:AraC-like DNA-binding protein
MPLPSPTSPSAGSWPAPSSGQHAIRSGLALCWGAPLSSAVLSTEPSIVAASAVLLFTLKGEGGNTRDQMTLLRPHTLRECDCCAEENSFYVAVALADPAWTDLIADDKTPGASQVRAFAADPQDESIVFPLTPAARLAVESIRRCPFVGTCREMALSARCHDLLIEFLTTVSRVGVTRPVTLTQSVDNQIRAAAELLAQNLETPPTIAELARRVGLSETTLKRGFHQVFDTTLFGYLRARRMERAHAALQSGAATVLEAAALVGYSNPSNFAAAFRRQFGVNPKTFQLAVRR